jgi:hypothetical protein
MITGLVFHIGVVTDAVGATASFARLFRAHPVSNVFQLPGPVKVRGRQANH